MFDLMSQDKVQELHFSSNGPLKAIIALHNLRQGPALGGCRFIRYQNETQAIDDAIRLAKGMSYKAALAGVPQGGGKSVIMMPEGDFDRAELFSLFGKFINSLNGSYITAMDSGTSVSDMDIIRRQTPFVASSSNIGDPSPTTAKGIVLGLAEAVEQAFNQSVQGLTVAIQGLGHVGMVLAESLHQQGAKIIVCDVDEQKVDYAVKHFDAKAVSVNEIYSQQCDVFSPCGLGLSINDNTIKQLKCKVIAGCANNQLAHDGLGQQLHDLGILYTPDYVINSGGLIYASSNFRGLSLDKIDHQVLKLKDTLNKIFILSKQKNIPTQVIADEMAEHVLYGNDTTMQEAI
ncbi:amino acid dehydrogenase [Bermanella marisrubri]|uniref:Glutamate dehydrogenase/leucine dehydrogenase n=1 Tax=Bermanella marisrubri TaxID=207949 RepID=Q1MYF2_9GAMM|nr:amino acid dehydrogenase [Bermanella marisrubri]EAT10993.1 Glutamate dehydrogenase/leucine dehydrogenase [Oceanobacter sp. RED65] [Bermanella marisrubri]QIZ83762.1 amino acid dehydrogenase [Bermanella marisrubri]